MQKDIQYVYKPVHRGRKPSTKTTLRYWKSVGNRLKKPNATLFDKWYLQMLDIWLKQDWEKKPLVSEETIISFCEGLWLFVARVVSILFIIIFFHVFS